MEEEAVINVKINVDNNEIELIEESSQKPNFSENDDKFMIDTKDENIINVLVEDSTDRSDEEGNSLNIKKEDTKEDVEEVVEHVCKKCFRSYTDVNRLMRHLMFCRIYKNENNYIEELENNISQIEAEAEKLEKQNKCFCCEESWETCHAGHIRCYECPKSFKNSRSFERHIFLLHCGNENHPCKTCNARCPTEKVLQIHQKSHNRGKPFACKKCGKEFTRRYHLHRHAQFSTCDNLKPKQEIFCKVCGKSFFRFDNLRSHLRLHLGEEPKNKDYQCPYCQKAFYGTATLNIHIRSHTGERPFPCDLCNRHFPSNAALRKHRRSHTGEKPYSCTVCGRAFAAKEVLNRHMKTHTGERPHSCSGCGKSFIQATQLRNHLQNCKSQRKSGEKNNIENIFECKICSQKMNSRYLLSKHLKESHMKKEVKATSTSDGTLTCKYCNACFKSAAGLKIHCGRAHKNKVFKCEICEAELTRKEELDFHLLQHNDDDPQKCRICDNEFQRKSHLFQHLRADHRPFLEQISECSQENNEETAILMPFDIEEGIPKSEIIFTIQELDVLDQKEVKQEENATQKQVKYEQITLTSDEELLTNDIKQLLNILVDQDILESFGWPSANVEHVLREVIRNCGHNPETIYKEYDYTTKMREYVKLLFTVVIDNDSIKELLNNHSVDEVIHQVLEMAQVDN